MPSKSSELNVEIEPLSSGIFSQSLNKWRELYITLIKIL